MWEKSQSGHTTCFTSAAYRRVIFREGDFATGKGWVFETEKDFSLDWVIQEYDILLDGVLDSIILRASE